MAEKYGVSEVDPHLGQKNVEAKKFNGDNTVDLQGRISMAPTRMPVSPSLQSKTGKPVGIIILCVLWALGGLFFIYEGARVLMNYIDWLSWGESDPLLYASTFTIVGVTVLGIMMLVAVYSFWSRRTWSKKLGIASPLVIMILSLVFMALWINHDLNYYGYEIFDYFPIFDLLWAYMIPHTVIAFVYILIGIIVFRQISVKNFFAGQHVEKKPRISPAIPSTPTGLSDIQRPHPINACQNCGYANVKGKKFCPQCGEKIEVVKFCPDCGSKNKEGTKFCSNCGKVLIETKRFCMHCGTKMPFAAKLCPKCLKTPPGGVDTKGCNNCKAVIPIVARFCSECGASQPK